MLPTFFIPTFWLLVIGATIYLALVVGCIVVVLSENRNPIRSLAWVIALLALPGIGLIFYAFFGRSLKGQHLMSKHNKRKILHNFIYKPVKLNSLNLSADNRQLIKLAFSLTHSPLTINNRIEFFTEGHAKFDALIRDLEKARSSIFIQYYIFSDDVLGQRIASILKEKARNGIIVKVIYDHVGSFKARSRFFKDMREAGVDVHPFFRVTFPQLANRINWRNHRKLVVIDGSIGYIGGMNIALRYITGIDKSSVWRDTHFRLQGDIVQSLIYSFAVDWFFMRDADDSLPLRPDENFGDHQLHNDCAMQLVTAGPMEPWNNLSLCFLKAISNAKKSIYIQTPYFLPTDALMNALEAAALAKTDVRIMIPAKTDSKLLQFATFSYISRCLKAGIKVYLYTPGMLHAKAMTIDDDFVTAGSTNFDFRSFENNFESNLMIYSPEVNKRMRDIYFSDLRHCRKLTYREWHSRPMPQRAFESLLRLFAPLL